MEARKEEELVEVIHSWSAPRSVSTVLMYSFAQRDDIEVLDEPLYANFLHVTGVGRPYREEVLSKMPSFDKVVPASFLELGLGELVSIYSKLCELGKPPAVIDASELQENPEATLCRLCEDLDIPFQPAMLKYAKAI